MISQRLKISFLCLAMLLLSGISAAQDRFPSKPIHIINPYAAGGIVDSLARVLAERLGETMGATFVVEAKTGANGNIGTDFAARAPADGYTWLIGTTSNAANMALMPNMRTDFAKAFVPVAQFASAPNYFCVPSSLPVSSLKEFVELAKSKPGSLSYGAGGIGSTPHLGFELFKHIAGIDVVGVQYKGGPLIVPDLVTGRLSAAYLPSSVAMTQAKANRVKIVATVGDTRTKAFPEVPTMAEAGYPQAVVAPWFVVLVPSGTPSVVVQRIENEIRAALSDPGVVTKIEATGASPRFRSQEDTRRMITEEIDRWKSLVKATGLKAE